MASAAQPGTQELIDEVRRAKDEYLRALERAYRHGVPLGTLRAAGLIARELG